MHISVIVPVYKVENYIEKCIHSLLAQTFNDFEIILVDDRSPDQSIHMAKAVLESQSRIPYKIITKETNVGLSAARNTGIEHSDGEYLLFVDSDDWIEKDMLQRMFESVISTKAGIIVCRVRQVYDDGVTNSELLNSLPAGTLPGRQALIKLFKGEFYSHIWKILFLKSSFDTTKFPNGTVYEDMLTLPYLLIMEERVSFIDDILYNYLQRSGSITKSYNPEIIKVVAELEKMEVFFESLLTKDERRACMRFIYLAYLVLVEHAAILSPNYKKAEEILASCRKNIKIWELGKQFIIKPSRSMLTLFLLKLSPTLFYKKFN